jgi:hypothetical protein
VRRAGFLLAAALPLLPGCPIPQPLAEVSKTGSGTVTPPRIVVEATPAGVIGTLLGVVPYDPACPGTPRFTVRAAVIDDNTDEVANFRWFEDYDVNLPTVNPLLVGTDQLPPPAAQPLNRREVPDLPYWPAAGGGFHLLELVVSNGFGPLANPPRNRAPAEGYEVQVFRWVFKAVSGTPCP